MDPIFWPMAIGSIVACLLAGLYGLYEVRKFDRRFGKPKDGER